MRDSLNYLKQTTVFHTILHLHKELSDLSYVSFSIWVLMDRVKEMFLAKTCQKYIPIIP